MEAGSPRAGEVAVPGKPGHDRKWRRPIRADRKDLAVAPDLVRTPVEHDQLAVKMVQRADAEVAKRKDHRWASNRRTGRSSGY